jgi:hypothetical protein
MVDEFDQLLDYFNKMSIDTSNVEHLDFIGKLMGFPRQKVIETGLFERIFRFTDIQSGGTPVQNNTGFSTSFALGDGGFLDGQVADSGLHLMDSEIYRSTLKLLSNIGDGIRGLDLIDALCYDALTLSDGSLIPYTISYDTEHSFGDIIITTPVTYTEKYIALQAMIGVYFRTIPSINFVFSG